MSVPELVALVCPCGSAGAAEGRWMEICQQSTRAAMRAHFSLCQLSCALSTSPMLTFGHLLAFPTFPLFFSVSFEMFIIQDKNLSQVISGFNCTKMRERAKVTAGIAWFNLVTNFL